MNNFLRVCLLVVTIPFSYGSGIWAQGLYESKSAIVSFTSSAPLENISASTTSVRGLLDSDQNNFAFSIEVKTFIGFNSDLQREHFNENYMEIERYPKATFTGKLIDKFDPHLDSQKLRAKGPLDIHGVKVERIVNIDIKKNGDSYKIISEFDVPLSDHGIRVPRIVNLKISETIAVKVQSEMVRK